ncbi:MAG: 3-keto-disaccharide hydrolase [Limisphaerales bacterium]
MKPISSRPWAPLLAALVLFFPSDPASAQTPPKGFSPLFNGKDLTGFRGGDTYDHRKLLSLPEAERKAQVDKWTASMLEVNPKTGKPHWYFENGELVNDGLGAYATTEKDYGDFELLIDYKTVPKADSGIYLRGVPQVQIWDSTEKEKFNIGADKGSGALWNNSPGAPGKDPLVLADKPFGQWNQFRIVMVGSRVSVWLNGKQVVKNAVMENYYDRKLPVPVKGPIQLQTHGGEIRWRNAFVREIPTAEADRILSKDGESGFTPILNGRDLKGWAGPLDNYEVVDGAVMCKAGKGGTIYTEKEYGDFVVRLEYKLPPGGNNGLAIRYPGKGDTAYEGMCELQVLDDNYEKVTNSKIDPRQAHGSAYGMAAAARGFQRPPGEWNYEEVTVKGSKIRVELNGFVVLDTDLSQIKEYLANSPHPGKERTRGHFGFAGHNDPVMFRNVRLREL